MGRVREGSRWGLPWLHDPEAKGEGGIGASGLEEVIQKLVFHRRDGEVAPARGAGAPPGWEQAATGEIVP